jgi:DNA-binding response OmpR family regulator
MEILKNLNVLYAEDDELMRENISKTLSLFVGKVYKAENGKEALELFRCENIHIVILDFVMPFMDGYTVASEIRKIDSDIPIIIISSFTEKEKLLSMMRLNLISYLEKPLQLNDLTISLKQSLERLEQKGKLNISLSKNIIYDYNFKRLIINNKEVILTKHEYQFLEILINKSSMLVMIREIEDSIYDGYVLSNTLRNMVYRLRKKINEDLIITVKDIGYILKIS